MLSQLKKYSSQIIIFVVAVIALYWVLNRRKSKYPKVVQDKIDTLKSMGIDKIVITQPNSGNTDEYHIECVVPVNLSADDQKRLKLNGFEVIDPTKPDSNYKAVVLD